MNDSWGKLLDALTRCRVLVVGDLMLDHYIWGDTTRISPEAPVPVVQVFRDTWVAGGAANVALNLTALGVSASIAGACGQDETGQRLRDIFSGHGMGTEALQVPDNAPTILKTRVVVQKQQICRIDREAAPSAYALRDLAALRQACAAVDAVIVSDYAKGVIDEALLEALAGCGKIIAVDPKPRRRLDYRGATLMTPNRNEALELAEISLGRHDAFPAREVCRVIWERYRPEKLVVTLGADGMLLMEAGEPIGRLPTRAREVFDVSGAGDTVIATLTAALAAGASLLEAAHLANAAAGVVVSKFGTATVSPEELRDALEDELEVLPVD